MISAIVADCHIWNFQAKGGPTVAGLNDRARICISALNRAIRKAKVGCAEDFIVAGDLVDHWRAEPQLLAAIKAEFSEFSGTIALLVGNHDRQSDHSGDHALGVLDYDVYDYPRRMRNRVFVPAPAKDAPENWLFLALEEACSSWGGHHTDLLVLHAGISDSQTPEFMTKGSRHVNVDELAELCQGYGFKSVVAGDWHQYKRWDFDDGLEVVQIGALCPTGWRDDGINGYGSVIFWDSDAPIGNRLSRKTVPGPRFVYVKSAEEAAEVLKNSQKGNSTYFRSTKPIDGATFAYDVVEPPVKYEAADVVADVEGVREALRWWSDTQVREDLREAVYQDGIRLVEASSSCT